MVASVVTARVIVSVEVQVRAETWNENSSVEQVHREAEELAVKKQVFADLSSNQAGRHEPPRDGEDLGAYTHRRVAHPLRTRRLAPRADEASARPPTASY